MPYLLLFTSLSTLICCALPALLVTLGLGAALAGAVGQFPQLIWLSENKDLVFAISLVMIAGSGFWIYKMRNAPCPLDPKLRDACIKGRAFSARIWFVSFGISLVGAFFAYILPLVSA